MRIVSFQANGQSRNIGFGKRRLPFVDMYTAVDIVNERYGTNVRPISLKTAHAVLHKSPLVWKEFAAHSPFLLDTVIGYKGKGKKNQGYRLGEQVAFAYQCEPHLYLNTGRNKRKKDCAVIVEDLLSVDIEMIEDNAHIWVNPDRIRVAEDFPKTSGWYEQDEKTGLPVGPRLGARLSSHPSDAIFFCRMEGEYAGPLHMDVNSYETGNDIFACAYPSTQFGVVLELSDEDVGAIKAASVRDSIVPPGT